MFNAATLLTSSQMKIKEQRTQKVGNLFEARDLLSLCSSPHSPPPLSIHVVAAAAAAAT